MDVGDLIKRLEGLPKDTPVRVDMTGFLEDLGVNYWVCDLEIQDQGSSGYPYGEVSLLISE